MCVRLALVVLVDTGYFFGGGGKKGEMVRWVHILLVIYIVIFLHYVRLFISQHILHSLLLDIVLKFLNMSADSSFWYLVLICEN